MLNRNSIPVGLGIGLLLPLAVYGLVFLLFQQLAASGLASSEGFSPMFRERTAGIVAICLNLIPLNYYQKRRAINTMRGLVLATVGLVVLWVVYFGKYIF